jgi:hypothetical protein
MGQGLANLAASIDDNNDETANRACLRPSPEFSPSCEHPSRRLSNVLADGDLVVVLTTVHASRRGVAAADDVIE